MKLKKVSDLFHVSYGVDLELNALETDSQGINFVARTAKNNGVSAKVRKLPYLTPNEAGTISVAAGGSVMESFLQPEPYYSGRDLFVLKAREEFDMSDEVKLFYCMCLRRNKFKYSYGRQANETLSELMIPDICEIPDCVKGISLKAVERQLMDSVQIEGLYERASIAEEDIELVRLDSIFDLNNGISSDKVQRSNRKVSNNWIPFIRPSYRQATSIDAYVNKSFVPSDKIYPKNTLYVSTDGQGSHTFSYVSATEFVPNSNVCVLTPKDGREMCLREKLFYALAITNNRFKFSYGRKPKGEKLGSILVPKFIFKEFNSMDIVNVIAK